MLVVFISRSIRYMIRTICSKIGGLRIQVVCLESGHIIQVSMYFEKSKLYKHRYINILVVLEVKSDYNNLLNVTTMYICIKNYVYFNQLT